MFSFSYSKNICRSSIRNLMRVGHQNTLQLICAHISSSAEELKSSFREIPIKVESTERANTNSWREQNTKAKTTFQEEEINKFRSLSSSWWNTQGELKPLHSLNKLRVPFVRDGLIQTGVAAPDHILGPRPLHGIRLLDVGCGGGLLSEPLARLGAEVTGLDACEESISVATLHAQKDEKVSQNTRYICGTIEDHARETTDLYDGVVASEVLEHVASVDLFVETCASLLKPGGSFFITTLNKTTRSWLAGIVLAEYTFGIVPKGTHDWHKFVPEQDLRVLLQRCGCWTRLVHGMRLLPLNNEWFWTADSSVNYVIHAVKKH